MSAEEQQQIENNKVREVLKRAGDKLTEEREIDHWAYFPDCVSRDSFINQALGLGFMLRGKIEPRKNNSSYGARLYNIGRPVYPELDQQTLVLFRLAVMLDETYDGWETRVIR